MVLYEYQDTAAYNCDCSEERRGIRWPEMHGKFPNVGPYAMLNFMGNCTKRKGISFRECLQSYLENPTGAAKSKKSKLDFGVILEIYFNHREMYDA